MNIEARIGSDTTTLFTPSEKIVMLNQNLLQVVEAAGDRVVIPSFLDEQTTVPFMLLTDVVGSDTPQRRRASLEVLETFVQEAFPDNYDLVSQQIAFQVQAHENGKRAQYQNIAVETGILIEPPGHISLHFLFDEHQLQVAQPTDYEGGKDSFALHLKNVFKTGQKNILVVENVERGFSARLFTEGYKKYHSYTKAFLYSTYVLNLGYLPFEEDLQNFLKAVKSSQGEKPGATYYRALYETVDVLNKEGYKIQIAFEDGTALPPIRTFSTTEDLVQWHQRNRENSTKREKAAAALITQIAVDYLDCQKPVNIFTIFGTDHQELPQYLPDILKGRVGYSQISDDTYESHPLIQYERGRITIEELARRYGLPMRQNDLVL